MFFGVLFVGLVSDLGGRREGENICVFEVGGGWRLNFLVFGVEREIYLESE